MRIDTLMVFAHAVVLCAQGSPAAGRVDTASTLVARTCVEVTREALAGPDIEALAAEGGDYAVEVWIAGEFSGDARVTLWRSSDGVRAEVATPLSEAGPVCSQLRRIYERDHSISSTEAARLIAIERTTFTGGALPELAQLLESVRHQRVSTSLGSSLFAPSRRLRVHFTNGLESVSVAFNVPEPSAESVAYAGEFAISQPQLSKWVSDLAELLGLP